MLGWTPKVHGFDPFCHILQLENHEKISCYPLVNIQKTMENHHLQWVNPLFLWPFSIAMLVITRGYQYQRGDHPLNLPTDKHQNANWWQKLWCPSFSRDKTFWIPKYIQLYNYGSLIHESLYPTIDDPYFYQPFFGEWWPVGGSKFQSIPDVAWFWARV